MGTGISETIMFINQVDSFYNSARNKLITIGYIIFGVIGILIPLVIQYYQRKTLKVENEKLENKIEMKFKTLKKELKKQIGDELIDITGEKIRDYYDEFEEKMDEYDKKMRELTAFGHAGIFHIQGNNSAKDNQYKSAISDFIKAARGSIIAKNYDNINTEIDLIIELLPKIKNEEKYEINENGEINKLIKELDAMKPEGIYGKKIKEINKLLPKKQQL